MSHDELSPHEHSVQEITQAYNFQLRQLHDQLEVARMNARLSKLALEKLLPNVGDSVVIDCETVRMENDQHEIITSMKFFRDQSGELSIAVEPPDA